MRINKKDGLNVVPFIDIMLVLLAIVLSISTFIAQGNIPIDLPTAHNTEHEQKDDDKKVSVVINDENKFFIDEQEIQEIELKDKLLEIGTNTLIELKSDKNAKFDGFVKIIDILKEKGHENFAISTIAE